MFFPHLFFSCETRGRVSYKSLLRAEMCRVDYEAHKSFPSCADKRHTHEDIMIRKGDSRERAFTSVVVVDVVVDVVVTFGNGNLSVRRTPSCTSVERVCCLGAGFNFLCTHESSSMYRIS